MSTLDPACEDDAGLLRAWCERRDEAALAALFARYAPALRTIARRVLHDEAEAEDVAQEVFIRLSEHAEEIGGPVEPWLRQVAAHTAISALRSRNRRRAREAQAATPSVGRPVLPAAGEGMEELVAECVAALTPAERDLVLRVFWGGEAQRDLARELQVSPVAVHKRLRASLDNLRRMLARRGVRVGAAALLASLGQLCGQEPSALAAQVRGGGGSAARWLAAGAVVAVGLAVAGLAWRGATTPPRSPSAGLDPVTVAAAPSAPPSLAPATAGPATAGRPGAAPAPAVAAGPGAGLPRWMQPAAEGWSPCPVPSLAFWLIGRRDARMLALAVGGTEVRLEGGDEPALRCEVPAESSILVMVPLPGPYEDGSQIRLEHRLLDAGAEVPWSGRLMLQLHALDLPEAPLVAAMVGGAQRHGGPVLLRAITRPQPERTSMASWNLKGPDPVAFVGVSRWRDPRDSFMPMAGAPPWWALSLPPGIHALRRIQVRALPAAERREVVEFVRAAPADGWIEQ